MASSFQLLFGHPQWDGGPRAAENFGAHDLNARRQLPAAKLEHGGAPAGAGATSRRG
jgi:hypothetical protein